MKQHTYISIDIEADGRTPGLNSMLQFGAAAFQYPPKGGRDPRKPVGTFKANLELLPGATQSPNTMAWWNTQGNAYQNTRIDTRPPEEVMPEFVAWVRSFSSPVIIGYPVTYDFGWIHWYTTAFGGLADDERCPFGFQGLDIKTLAAERLGVTYKSATKRNMPRHWFEGAPPHTHDGLDDAIGQGILFINIMRDRR